MMQKRNVLIVEDNHCQREALIRIISEISEELNIYDACNTAQAYDIAMEKHIHLFLVDIILNPDKPDDVAGLKFAQRIRDVKEYMFTPLIFVTSLEDPKMCAYQDLHCYGYVEKPYAKEQVHKLVRDALQFPVHKEEDRVLYFRKDGIVYAKNLSEVIYIESSHHKITIHCKRDTLEIPYKTIDKMLEEMNCDAFVKCSRSTIINKKCIDFIDYTNRYIKLKGIEEPIEIGSTMKKRFKESMGHE